MILRLIKSSNYFNTQNSDFRSTCQRGFKEKLWTNEYVYRHVEVLVPYVWQGRGELTLSKDLLLNNGWTVRRH